jgi:hypothetical protein
MRADSPHPLTTTAPTADLQAPPQPATTAADQVFDLTESAGSLRSRARDLHEDTSALHQSALVNEWQRLTNLRARTAPATLLQELADLGFGWRDIARMLRVSVPAVQKWRRNGGVSGPHRRSIASLLALCDLVRERYMIQEIASWFEMPISEEAPVTPIDLYAEERVSLLLDYASGQGSDPEQLLNAYDPAWRQRFQSDFEVYQEADGNMSIRPRSE